MSDRSALIVGPGNAFGFELARDLHAEGYDLAVVGASPGTLNIFSDRLFTADIPHHPVMADVCNYARLEQAVIQCADILPPWEVAVYNVKDSPYGDALSLSPYELKESLDSNVVGVLRLGQVLVSEWERTENATYILSGGGYKDKPNPNKLALGVAKGALHTLATAMRPIYALENVSIKEVIIDGRVDADEGISPELVSKRYIALTKSKRDTIVIDEKSK